MNSRRPFLAAVVMAIAATAPARVRASTDVEGVGYGGVSGGGWACGPLARSQYGGVGARVRVAETPARFGGMGWTGEVAAAGEKESTKIVDCRHSCDSTTPVTAPPTRVMLGGHARAGYQWEHFGLEGGATVYQGWENPDDRSPTVAAFPDLQLSFGSRETVRGMVGLGSPEVTMLRRPGFYAGADIAAGTVDVEARFGAYRSGPSLIDGGGDGGNVRGDLVALVPITSGLKVRVGGSLSKDDAGEAGEGSIGLRGSL